MRVGDPVIDEQHQVLFRQFALLTDAIMQAAYSEQVVEILNFLDDYANTHGLEEERLMEVYAYPGIEEQRRQHVVFKENVATLLGLLEEGVPPKELAIRIDALLIRYGINHIRNLDTRMVEFIKEKQASELPAAIGT
jgi:hemerythrin